MPLKYVWQEESAVRIVGMLHGVLWVLYVGLAFIVLNKGAGLGPLPVSIHSQPPRRPDRAEKTVQRNDLRICLLRVSWNSSSRLSATRSICTIKLTI